MTQPAPPTFPFTIPLHYYRVQVGDATVDKDIGLVPYWQWRVEIPASIRARRFTADVLVAMLREDASTLQRCHPILTLSGLVPFAVRLSRVILRPTVIPLLNDLAKYPRTNPRKEMLTYEVTKLCRSVHRVINLNGNTIDCRRENLRELSVEFPRDDIDIPLE